MHKRNIHLLNKLGLIISNLYKQNAALNGLHFIEYFVTGIDRFPKYGYKYSDRIGMIRHLGQILILER